MSDLNAERPIAEMTAIEVRDYLDGGAMDVPSFHDQVLAHAHAVDERIQCFSALDDRVVRLQAEHLHGQRLRGEAAGALFGVPVGIKDIIDTIDFPTCFGSPIHEGRYAVSDATVVRRLRDAGAVILDKTVTTEFATFTPGPTRNPHNPAHTPGGSSSGSAAAVAAGAVPLAIGTQTNGSVLRPASYCGVYGFKPSRGAIPRTGILEQSASLDQVGIFARNIADLALAAEVIGGDDGQDALCKGLPPRRLARIAAAEPPVQPRLCFVRTPWWDRIEPEAREAYEALLELMAGVVVEAELPPVVEQAVQWHSVVNEVELAFSLQREFTNSPQLLSPGLRDRVAAGMQVPSIDYLRARDRIEHAAVAFDEYFEHYDAILCPAALGGAPEGLASTGDPLMQTLWTFAGLPALSMPLITLSSGLPLGVQAVGALHNDARLLRTANWFVDHFIARSQD